jgi:hypothetical protein
MLGQLVKCSKVISSVRGSSEVVRSCLLNKFSTSLTTTPSAATANTSKLSSFPYIENYRPRWPQPAISTEIRNMVLPKRTVADSDLRFELKATMDQGQAIYYPHLKFNPIDFKVKLFVSYHFILLDCYRSHCDAASFFDHRYPSINLVFPRKRRRYFAKWLAHVFYLDLVKFD